MASTILIVEDSPRTRKMLRVTLESEGYIVVEAADARAALAAVARTPPDLILQDLILPDMDGLELMRQLRDVSDGSPRPILALSGFLSRLEESRTAEAGFTALLVKPIEPSRLIEAIRACLPQEQGPPVGAGSGARLLIVDDDAVQLKLQRVSLSNAGFAVTAVGSAADALTAARASPPDLVLSDVVMPDIDGFQLCLQMRGIPELARVPVVLLSSQSGSAADDEMARCVGANALVVRTPDLGEARRAIAEALESPPPRVTEPPSDALRLLHAQVVIQRLERERATMAGLAQRCALQAAELSLLSGVADALTRRADTGVAIRDVLAATLDAAGISKGALLLRDDGGLLRLAQHIGFSRAERSRLREFFGHLPWLEALVERGGSVSVPSASVAPATASAILEGANVVSLHVVPLMSGGRAMGAMVIGASSADVTESDSVAFARAIGNQIVQSIELARTVAQSQASEQRYRTLLEGASDAIAVFTPDGVVREVNRRWEELTGSPRHALVGRHVRDFLPDRSGGGLRTFDDVVHADSDTPVPVAIVRVDGSRALLEVSVARIDVGGEPLIFTISRDVTEQRRLEDQLRQAQKLEAVGQLAGGVAHDFNNLLTAILGFTESAMLGLPPGEVLREDLLEVQKAGQRAAALTRQLLAFSRKQILEPRVLDINGVVAGLEPMLRRLVFEDITLTVSLAPDTGLLDIDPTQIEQLLVNLVVNAADAMPHGGRLRVETGAVSIDGHYQGRLPVAPGAYVMLAVRDTGVGVDQHTAARMFEPFFTTKGAGKGTGLGLATVYGIVKQCGGDIRVDSEPGRGTTFTIYLPQTARTASVLAHRGTATTELPRGAETILVVEDDDAVRRLVRATLERNGYHVLDAANPREAAQVAAERDEPIHLLLSDVIMPESDGPPLLEQLRIARPALLVLYMSGYADDAVARRGMIAEGTPFLQKPFTAGALTRKVRDALEAATT